MPTATATDPPLANPITMHSRLFLANTKPPRKVGFLVLHFQPYTLQPEVSSPRCFSSRAMAQAHIPTNIGTYRQNQPRGQFVKHIFFCFVLVTCEVTVIAYGT